MERFREQNLTGSTRAGDQQGWQGVSEFKQRKAHSPLTPETWDREGKGKGGLPGEVKY